VDVDNRAVFVDGLWKGMSAMTTDEPRHVMLAREAVELGWTVPRIVRALRARIRRDEHYLAYRQLKGFHTAIDAAILADLRLLALAAFYLEEGISQERDYAAQLGATPDHKAHERGTMPSEHG
jgi:hypothetical protein